MNSAQIPGYYWSVFSCIRTEYGDQPKCRKIRPWNNSIWTLFRHWSCVIISLTSFNLCNVVRYIHINFTWLIRYVLPVNCSIIIFYFYFRSIISLVYCSVSTIFRWQKSLLTPWKHWTTVRTGITCKKISYA